MVPVKVYIERVYSVGSGCDGGSAIFTINIFFFYKGLRWLFVFLSFEESTVLFKSERN